MALPQPLHIFRKDLRHLLPETLISVLFLVAFAFVASYDVSQSQIGGLFPIFGLFLRILIPITWLIVISRLIQDEPLVGDRQFWTSRPYHWAKLLGAKLLYLLVFLYLPFFLMQVFLLWHAGLYPAQAMPGLLHNLLLLTVYIVMPIAVLSAVTSSFVWTLLSVLGAVIYIGILTAVLFFFVLRYLTPPELEPILYTAVILLPLLVLVYQYATRKTTQSRIALLAVPLVLVVIILATPAAALIRAAYPVDHDKDAPKLSELPDQYRPKTPQPGRLAVQGKNIQLAIPFLVSGVDRESNYVVGGTEATIDAPGLHWSSRYAGNGFPPQPLQLNGGSPFGVARIFVPADVFDRSKGLPANVHVSLAAQHFKADKPETWKANAGSFSVPGNGVCAFDKMDPLHFVPICKYAFQSPELNLVSAAVRHGSCAAGGPSQLSRTRLEGKPASLDFDPVVQIPLEFTAASQQDPSQREPLTLCPGTPLEFIVAKPVSKVRLEVDEKNLLLNNYAIRIATDQPAAGPGQRPPTATPQ